MELFSVSFDVFQFRFSLIGQDQSHFMQVTRWVLWNKIWDLDQISLLGILGFVASAWGALHHNIMNSSAGELSYKYIIDYASLLSRYPRIEQSTTSTQARTHDTSWIPPCGSFPINTSFDDASLLSRYPRVKQSTTTTQARTHDTSLFLLLLFSDRYVFYANK